MEIDVFGSVTLSIHVVPLISHPYNLHHLCFPSTFPSSLPQNILYDNHGGQFTLVADSSFLLCQWSLHNSRNSASSYRFFMDIVLCAVK